MKFSFTAKVLRKHLARYEVCDACGFLRAHEPYWLDEAYSSAIAAADTGLVARNYSLQQSLQVRCIGSWVSAVQANTWTLLVAMAC
jgi:hypothetical protein